MGIKGVGPKQGQFRTGWEGAVSPSSQKRYEAKIPDPTAAARRRAFILRQIKSWGEK